MDFTPGKLSSENSISGISNTQNNESAKHHSDQLLTFADLSCPAPDVFCFSHLRWDFVFQRPQHLLTRFAAQTRVFFWEEPIFDADSNTPCYVEVRPRGERINVIVPHLPAGIAHEENEQFQRELLAKFIEDHELKNYIAWYYTPMALGFTSEIKPVVTVFDCMDELSAFAGAPPELRAKEQELMRRAQVMFTGGYSLYEAKRDKHHNVHAFPSSIERKHFAQARTVTADPEDQANIPHPRLGFYGVIDERLDIRLLEETAKLRPDWHFVLLGPVVKIDPATLPRLDNIHYLGMKSYQELPHYLGGWDVAILPFALNESTRFISPTKTPEYLAAGRPVVSTPIRDVVRTYGESGMVQVAGEPEAFVSAVEKALAQGKDATWLEGVDNFLANHSWDKTWAEMTHLICKEIKK